MECNVLECYKIHKRHYCRLCEDDDSCHFSTEFSYSRTLYHGTRFTAVPTIVENGIRKSQVGRLGGGVYFAKTLEHAKKISEYRDRQNGSRDENAVVVKCQVYMGLHKHLAANSDWQIFYDSACAMHPPWAGITVTFLISFSLSIYLRLCSHFTKDYVPTLPKTMFPLYQRLCSHFT